MGVFVLVYIDDIFVFSKRVKDHPGHVKEVLRRLREHKLIAKLRKCKFHQTKLDWVGLVISNKGIETDQEKVTAAMNWKAPKNVKQVQEFLGFVNFYQRFIQDFAGKARPLYNLLKKDQKWQWTSKEQEAMNALKEALKVAPVMMQPDQNKEFFLETDASGFATGAVLSQKDEEGKLHPVAFLSKSLNPAERNYDIFDKELLAIIRAFKEWRHLLQGTEKAIQVVTDHKNLEYFSSSKQLNQCQICWMNFLVDFNFQILYRPGNQNKKADILSRQYDLEPLGGGREPSSPQTRHFYFGYYP
jgi:hypothetical protein